MNKFIKIFRIIINAILVVMIILLGIYAVLRLTGRVEIFKVRTGSMEEGIHAGDYILIVQKGDYHVDDIVTYKRDGYHVTHRIIKIDGDNIITKGDANNVEDKAITQDDIVGKLIYKGRILNFILEYKYFIVIGFLIVYFISSTLDKRGNAKEENVEESEAENEEVVENEDSEEIEEDTVEETKTEEEIIQDKNEETVEENVEEETEESDNTNEEEQKEEIIEESIKEKEEDNIEEINIEENEKIEESNNIENTQEQSKEVKPNKKRKSKKQQKK